MKRSFALACVAICFSAPSTACGALNDFALSSVGATVLSNASDAERLINGRTREDGGIYPTWNNVAQPFFRIDLPADAAGLPLHQLQLFDAVNVHPFQLDVLDSSNSVLASFSSTAGQDFYDFAPALPLLAVDRLEFQHLGSGLPSMRLAEVTALFESSFRVGGVGIGVTTLTELIHVGGTPGSFDRPAMIRLNELGPANLKLTEVQILDADGNVLPVSGWEGGLVAGMLQQLTDGIAAPGNGATIGGYAGFGTGSQGRPAAIRFTSDLDRAQDLSQLATSARNPNLVNDLYYYESFAASSNEAGHTETFQFAFGRTSTGILESDETYEFEIVAAGSMSDRLAVRKLEPQTAVTVLDVNNSSLELVIRGAAPQLGDRFDLLSADQIVGRFEALVAPPLPGGLRWDFSNLYADGSVSVAAVPEANAAVLAIVGWLSATIVTRRIA